MIDNKLKNLYITEILDNNGNIKYRYTRYLSEDGTHWIRHGLFVAYYENGTIASEGVYKHGLEDGLWQDYYDNGCLAAKGYYKNGEQLDGWEYWDNVPET